MEVITAYKTSKGEIFENKLDAEQQELNYENFDFMLTEFINRTMFLDSKVKGYVQHILTTKSDELINILNKKPKSNEY